jgi:DNA-binding response OmpR family regulator
MKILYIEDDQRVAALICTLLREQGYDVEYFALGNAGLERFNQDVPAWDAVIIDLNLPDVSGQSILPQIAVQRPNLPIVVYSGVSGLNERFELYSSGAAALLTKPTNGQDLLDVLKGLIESPPEPIR